MKKVLLKQTNIDTSMLLAKVDINTEKKTKNIAEELYKISKVGDIFALKGELGVGKTTLAKYFIMKGGKEKRVVSPSYNIFFKYSSEKSSIYHLDAWRLEEDKEILELGVIDYFYEAIFLIEWADKIEKYLPKNRLVIHIKIKDESRILFIKGNEIWKERLKSILDGN